MSLSLFLVWAPAANQLYAREAIKNWADWSNVSTLQLNQRVEVQPHKGVGKKVKGRFLAGDQDGITIRTKRGEQRVPRENVRVVKAVRVGREGYTTAGGVIFLAGLGTSILLANTGVKKKGLPIFWDITWKRFGVAMGVMIGGLIAGLTLGQMGKPKRVYEVPPREPRKVAEAGVPTRSQ